MVSTPERCNGLEPAGTLALYIQLSEAERPFAFRSQICNFDLASATETGRGAYPGVLPGLRVVEDLGAPLRADA